MPPTTETLSAQELRPLQRVVHGFCGARGRGVEWGSRLGFVTISAWKLVLTMPVLPSMGYSAWEPVSGTMAEGDASQVLRRGWSRQATRKIGFERTAWPDGGRTDS